MLKIVAGKSIFRKPSRGELVFLTLLSLIFFISGNLGRDLPFAPFDWMQQSITAQVNQKEYDGDGIVVFIDDQTFDALGRSEWMRGDLAKLLVAINKSGPSQVAIDRQYFSGSDQEGIDSLREAIEGMSSEIFWQIPLQPEDMGDLEYTDAPPPNGAFSASSSRLDPGAKGLVVPTAMAYQDTSLFAPLRVWYSIAVDDSILPTTAQVLSSGQAPESNVFFVDLSYNPASVPAVNASEILTGDFREADLRNKRIVIAFTDNLARDTIQTPGNYYASRAAVTLMAAHTLTRGPPIQIGWVPSFLIALSGALLWVFLRRPWGRLAALLVLVLLPWSTLYFEQHLIFQSTSHGVFLILVLAIGKVWMRGREAVQTYRSADETKSRFLAQASHDLRQPIHAIGLLSERLAQTDLTPDQAALVKKISWSVDNASRMFRALLDIAAIESGTLKAHPVPVSINEMLAEIDSQNGLLAEQAGVDLRLVPSTLIVQADRALIGTMLQNLVSNAIKYSPRGKVVVGARKRGDRVSLHVIDNGRGIPQAELKNVQKEFYRSSSKSVLGSENKGLGLAIVNRLALMLNLKFELKSKEGNGTAATIGGLMRVSDQAVSERKSTTQRLPLSGLRVAIADDDRETLKSTQKLLEQWGCEVTSFDHFPDIALDQDILVTDFDFGNGDTLAVRAAALLQIKGQGIRLMIVSGHHPDAIRDSLPGITDLILSKPLRAAELRSALMSMRMG